MVILGFVLIILLLIPKPIEEGFENKNVANDDKTPPIYTNKNLPNPPSQTPLKGNPNLTWNENAVTTKWISDLSGYLPSI